MPMFRRSETEFKEQLAISLVRIIALGPTLRETPEGFPSGTTVHVEVDDH